MIFMETNRSSVKQLIVCCLISDGDLTLKIVLAKTNNILIYNYLTLLSLIKNMIKI